MDWLISLDLSSKPGFAVYHKGVLIRYGTLFQKIKVDQMGPYPMNYVSHARHVVERIRDEVILPLIPALELEKLTPRDIQFVIEETTASSQNYTQKTLEFIHCGLIQFLVEGLDAKVSYIRDGVWKRVCGANQNAAEKALNAKISRYKKKHNVTLAKFVNEQGKLRVKGKLDRQDYYIRAVKEIFGLEFTKEFEDTAAAILIGLAYLRGAPLCDGTTKGGLLAKEPENWNLRPRIKL
jgi:hypothetical protein